MSTQPSMTADTAAQQRETADPAHVMSRSEIYRWCNALAADMATMRHETYPTAFWQSVAEHLLARSFRTGQATTARLWILEGKRPRRTQLSDFFPTAEQMLEVGCLCISIADHRTVLTRACRDSYQQGITVERRRHESGTTNAAMVAALAEKDRQILALTAQLAQLRLDAVAREIVEGTPTPQVTTPRMELFNVA